MSLDAILLRAAKNGLRRGLSGEHWSWLALAGAAFWLRHARRSDEAVTTIDLAPGESYVVSLHEPS